MPQIYHTQLVDHLTVEQLEARLGEVADVAKAAPAPIVVVLDCREMTSYELAARSHFVEWNAANRARVRGMAIVVSKPLWFAVIATMSMVSRQLMKAFRDIDDATSWAEQLEDASRPSA